MLFKRFAKFSISVFLASWNVVQANCELPLILGSFRLVVYSVQEEKIVVSTVSWMSYFKVICHG